jgi:hypothetical protein
LRVVWAWFTLTAEGEPVRLLAAVLVGASLAAASGVALAQEPTSSPGAAMAPQVTTLQLSPLFGEPTGSGGALPPALAVLPLRLALLGDAFPIAGALGGAPCAPREGPSGNASWGFPVQRQAVLPLTSRLVLHGFSSLGCPLDAGMGGGLTFAAPLRRDLWLVAAAGVYGQPSLPGRSLLRTDARLDVVMRATTDHPLAVGIGKRGLTFSGWW